MTGEKRARQDALDDDELASSATIERNVKSARSGQATSPQEASASSDAKAQPESEDGKRTQAPASSIESAYATTLSPGDRIEVQWDIVDEKEGGTNATTVWWGCKFVGPADSSKPAGPGALYTLRYDKGAGFEASDSTVMFVDENLLFDLTYEDVLFWRAEGAGGNDGTFSMLEVLINQLRSEIAENKASEQGDAKSVYDLAMEAFQKVSFFKQQRFAQSYRSLADRVKSKLRELQQSQGKNYVVKPSDIHTMFQELQEQKTSPP